MLFTDEGTKVPSQIYPLAFANGMEWSTRRRGHRDRFDCLYRKGIGNKALWYRRWSGGLLGSLEKEPR